MIEIKSYLQRNKPEWKLKSCQERVQMKQTTMGPLQNCREFMINWKQIATGNQENVVKVKDILSYKVVLSYIVGN